MPTDDFEYGLDAEHIEGVCKSATGERTVGVTRVDMPARAFVNTDEPGEAVHALRRVGYAATPSRHTVVVHGWSIDRLDGRITGLTDTLDRLRRTLPDAAHRAVDAYVTRAADAAADDEPARNQATDAVRRALRHDIDTITGSHVPHDRHIRPTGYAAELLDQVHALEQEIDQWIDQATSTAQRAVETYAEHRALGLSHDAARHEAVTDATVQAREHRVVVSDVSAPEHPAAIAAADQPDAARTPARPSAPRQEPGPTAGTTGPLNTPSRGDHR